MFAVFAIQVSYTIVVSSLNGAIFTLSRIDTLNFLKILHNDSYNIDRGMLGKL